MSSQLSAAGATRFEGSGPLKVEEFQLGTTREGVQLGAMAGTVDLIPRCYSVLDIRDDVLRLHPSRPPELPPGCLGNRLPWPADQCRADPNAVRLRLYAHSGDSITVCVETG